MTEPREGMVRRPPVLGGGHLANSFALEIYFRGEWVMFGGFGNINSSDLEWQDAYRALCQEVLDCLLEGQEKGATGR